MVEGLMSESNCPTSFVRIWRAFLLKMKVGLWNEDLILVFFCNLWWFLGLRPFATLYSAILKFNKKFTPIFSKKRRKKVFTYSNITSFSFTNSLRKWYFIVGCLVLVCITWFYDILIELVFSQKITTRSLILTFVPTNRCLKQKILEQLTSIFTYYAFIFY